MAADLRAVFDTNVVVSAVLFSHSMPRKAFDRVVSDGQVLISAATAAELNEVLCRERFDPYVDKAQRLAFLASLVGVAELVEITEVVSACRDPKDNRFLDLALSGKATYIISGDQDLLVLHPFRGIPILTPRAFLDEFTL